VGTNHARAVGAQATAALTDDPAMRNLLLGLSIGIASLLVGGTAVALLGIVVLAPLAAALLALRHRPSHRARLSRAASQR
jgi:uncharacterized protein (DUF58 family)